MLSTIRTESPDNRRINERKHYNTTRIWSKEPWRFLRLLFLSRHGWICSWCGNVAQVVAHDGWDAYGKEEYYDFERTAKPLCRSCNAAERQGKVLCPRCRKQGHYVPGNDPDAVCWTCKSPEEREAAIYRKEHRERNRNAYNQRQSKKAYRIKKERVKKRMVKTVRIQDDDTGATTHWETCRHEQCIEYDCPRYYLCCGEVK